MEMISSEQYTAADEMIATLRAKSGVDFSTGREHLAELMIDAQNGHWDNQTCFDHELGLRDFRFIQEDEYENGRDDDYADLDDDEFAFALGYYFFWA